MLCSCLFRRWVRKVIGNLVQSFQNNQSFRNKQIVVCMTTLTSGVIQLIQPLGEAVLAGNLQLTGSSLDENINSVNIWTWRKKCFLTPKWGHQRVAKGEGCVCWLMNLFNYWSPLLKSMFTGLRLWLSHPISELITWDWPQKDPIHKLALALHVSMPCDEPGLRTVSLPLWAGCWV